MLIAMAGLPGTGKSTLASRLAEELSGVVLNKDQVRASLFPARYVEYSTEQDDLCVSILLQVAGFLLRRDPALFVFVDGRTFSRRSQVEALDRFAQEQGASLRIIECVCSDETARQRLEGDAARAAHPATNRDYDLYLSVKARFEPIREPKLVVNTDEPLEACVSRCLAYVRGSDPETR